MDLKRIFLGWLLAILLLILLFAAFGPKGKKIDWANPGYQTSQSAGLFFKNLRAYYYDKESFDSAGIELYRIKTRAKNQKDSLQLVLMRNWKTEELFVLFEKSDHLAWQKGLNVYWEDSDSSGAIHLNASQVDEHYRFAAQLYYRLDKGSKLFLNQKESPMSENTRKSLKTTLKDYFKWVGKLR